MGLTSRQSRPLDRSTTLRDARLVVIATEGEKTEKIYFSIFGSTKVKVQTIPCEDGKSSPEHTLARLEVFRRKYELDSDDELWLAIDKDRWTNKALAEVARRSKAAGFGLALSNPCFEIWLLLHYLDDVGGILRSADAEVLLREKRGGYNKSKYDPADFFGRLDDAIERAKILDIKPRERWPNQVGSRVYRIVESILERIDDVSSVKS